MSDETKPDLHTTNEDETNTDLEDETNTDLEDETNTDLDVVPEETAGNVLEVVTNFISRLDPSTLLGQNASKAFGQLCSAPNKWYNAYFEGKAAEAQAGSESRIKITERITDQIVENIEVDPEYARRAGHKFAGKIIGEQGNLDKISAIAADELKNEQSDNSTNQDTSEPTNEQSDNSTNQDTSEPTNEQPANSSNPEANSGEEKVIDDDWLNSFETEARQKSTEDMQLRFGRILAGEIRQPGSYSIKAVKVLGELDKDVAALFKRFCSMCLVSGVLGGPDGEFIIDARVSSLGGDPSSSDLSKYGLSFYLLKQLNEYGLIIPAYNLPYDFRMHIKYEDDPVVVPFEYQKRYWILQPLPARRNDQYQFGLLGVPLSFTGRELFRIVDQDPMPKYTEDLKKFFAEQHLSMIEVNSPGTQTI